MRAVFRIGILATATIAGCLVCVAQPSSSSNEAMKAPIAKKVPKTLKIHGYEVVDNYAWLRDRNAQKDPAIISYLEDNNRHTESFMVSNTLAPPK